MQHRQVSGNYFAVLSKKIEQHSKSIFFMIGCILAVLVGFLLLGSAASAQDGQSEITLSPPSTRLRLNPGETYHGSFKIINSGVKPFAFKVYSAPYQVQGEEYDPVFSKDEVRTQISRWISFDQTEYSLEPKQIAEVEYQIKTPSNVASGGQYAVIFAETIEDEGSSAIVAKKRVGMLIYSSVKGDTKEAGKMLSVQSDGWQAQAPLEVKWRIENSGNTDFEATTKLSVKNIFGKEVYASDQSQSAVLPETTRAITREWQDAKIGLYKVSTEVQFLNQTEQKEFLVMVMPPMILVAIVIGILLLVAVLVFVLRKKRQAK